MQRQLLEHVVLAVTLCIEWIEFAFYSSSGLENATKESIELRRGVFLILNKLNQSGFVFMIGIRGFWSWEVVEEEGKWISLEKNQLLSDQTIPRYCLGSNRN
jgi:hypothetical protein